jgi:hypothetical protein
MYVGGKFSCPWKGDSTSIPGNKYFEAIDEAAEMGIL